ncbi:MAG: hypothetical protein ABIE42_05740 [Candidatus Eisenbacteria bacterium]
MFDTKALTAVILRIATALEKQAVAIEHQNELLERQLALAMEAAEWREGITEKVEGLAGATQCDCDDGDGDGDGGGDEPGDEPEDEGESDEEEAEGEPALTLP